MSENKQTMMHFTPEMVRALFLNKTQTRRPITPKPDHRHHRLDLEDGVLKASHRIGGCWHVAETYKPPYGVPGDTILVRERARVVEGREKINQSPLIDIFSHEKMAQIKLAYEADGVISDWIDYPSRLAGIVRSRCIPNGCFKEAARIKLLITNLRAERLQDIGDGDIRKEGITISDSQQDDFIAPRHYHNAMIDLWNSIYAKRGLGWDVPQWVWVYDFEMEVK